MKGLLLKDILELKLKMRATFIFMLFYTLFSAFYFKSLTMFVVIMAMFSITFPLTVISLDERSKWGLYVLTTPLSRKDYVLSKYILSLICFAAAFLIELAVIAIFGRSELSDILPLTCVMLGGAMLFSAFMLPFALWLGTEKTRYVMLVLFLLPTAAIMYFANSGSMPPMPFDEAQLQRTLTLYSPIIGFALFALSFPAAVALYSRREL